MAMDLNAKAAYIRGLMTGMEFDPNSKNGKIIAAMMDLLEEMPELPAEERAKYVHISLEKARRLEKDSVTGTSFSVSPCFSREARRLLAALGVSSVWSQIS